MTAQILIFVGGSGVGKTSLTRLLARRDGYERYPTYTTRPIRSGERDGDDYRFLTDDCYDAEQTAGSFYNNLTIGGYRYAIPNRLLVNLGSRRIVLHLVHEWALKIKADFPNVCVVLVRAPSVEEQARRLAERGEAAATIERRLADVTVQSPPEAGCDLVLINETGALERTYRQLHDYLGL